MSSRLRLPALAFAGLSIVLSLAVIGSAGNSLRTFNEQHSTNVWLLPVWPDHFDLRSLKTVIGTSVGVLLLNLVAVVALFIAAMPVSFTILVASIVSTILALVAIILPSIINNKAPTRDTLQTWTCRWSGTNIYSGQQAPAQFDTLCRDTRFATYTAIPLFILQLLLVATAVFSLVASKRASSAARSGADLEKMPAHELGQYNRQSSFDTKGGSPKSTVTESAQILPAKGQA